MKALICDICGEVYPEPEIKLAVVQINHEADGTYDFKADLCPKCSEDIFDKVCFGRERAFDREEAKPKKKGARK